MTDTQHALLLSQGTFLRRRSVRSELHQPGPVGCERPEWPPAPPALPIMPRPLRPAGIVKTARSSQPLLQGPSTVGILNGLHTGP